MVIVALIVVAVTLIVLLLKGPTVVLRLIASWDERNRTRKPDWHVTQSSCDHKSE